MINRRAMLWTMGLSAVSARSAISQQHTWRVGFLALPRRPEAFEPSRFGAFVRGMRDLGYIEGRNLVIEWRFADNEVGRLSALATELVNLKVDVIVASGSPVIGVAQKAAITIPIVMPTSNDPVGSGFVASLGRPGGNTTGLSNLSSDISPKVVEVLLRVAPKVSRVAILVNPKNPSNAANAINLQIALQGVGPTGLPAEASTVEDIAGSFFKMKEQNADAVIVAPDALFVELATADRRLGTQVSAPLDVFFSRTCRGGGPNELRAAFGRQLSARSDLRG